MTGHDYFAVMLPPASRDGRARFLCNVLARDKNHAMKTARSHGFRLPRGAHAIHIGRDGYFAALRRVSL